MSDCSKNRNPLVRNGTSQGQRVLSKLSPTSVQIMDKSPEDWMVWAARFSDNINFTTINNATAGTMKPFFAANVSAQLALSASYEPSELAQFIREQLLYIETEETNLKSVYTNLYDTIFSYFLIVDRLFQFTTADKEFSAILRNHIEAKLLPLEKRSFRYYNASIAGNAAQRLIVSSEPIDLHIFHEPIKGHEDFLEVGLSNLAGKRYPIGTDFQTYFNSYTADFSILGGMGNPVDKIKYIAQHNFFTSILDEIVASTNFITKLTQKYIQKYLSDWANHPPHYALFLTWIQLLEHTKTHLNELTGRHLDFYYKEVLQLKPLAQEPDKAFLILELNKITAYHAIPAGTKFLGPKDENGKAITFSNSKETVLNKASIKQLSSIYFGDADDAIAGQNNNGRLFAAPIANSADGNGEEIKGDIPSWHPFHIKTFQNGALTSINMPQATIGFAVASHYLRLKEGLRKITLEIDITNTVKFNNFAYKAYITTEKEWLLIDQKTLSLTKGAGNKVTKMTFTFTIPADKDPITKYDQAVHEGSLTATEPVLKVILSHNNLTPFIYSELSNANLSNINIKVNVGEVNGTFNQNGIKSLELHNDGSPLNPSKPFDPWGFEPKLGNSFIVGSDEIFYKKGAKLQFNFEWKDYLVDKDGDIQKGALDFDAGTNEKYNPFFSSSSGYTPKVEIQKLSKNKWEQIQDNVEVFKTGSSYSTQVALEIDLSANNKKEIFLERDKQWKAYNANSNKGYLKIKLKNDFGHRDYYQELQSFLKIENDSAIAPAYPYQPTLQSFSVSYEASCNNNVSTNSASSFNSRDLDFFNIGPFGDSQQHKFLQNSDVKLLSNLIEKTDGNYKSQGSLFIGFENIQPEDTVQVLFQLQEGSENPLLEKPDEHLKWEYLKEHNVWEELPDENVGDTTNQLIESGIISFIIPKDAAKAHTAFETGLIWLRCSVKEAPDAVCKIIGVFPNAVEVERIIPEETDYENMLVEAGQIKKLVVPEARIKKVNQPYTSFDGNPVEDSESFYLRASERLRHKNRAITIWDYERLVLQAFPSIYKVKCLNHTKITGSLSEGNLVYNEVAPGNVAIITIPNLANRNDIDPLKPYTKKSMLQNIEDFLNERSSCHVKIWTAQPDFEEVKVKCTIVLRSEYPDTNYYRTVIQQEITNFLSPWAFKKDAELNFGGRVHQSVLIDFIEELPYVDFLTNFELRHIKSDGTNTKVEEAIASTARSILVSVAASIHDLNVILKPAVPNPEMNCADE